jgi:hypothetical protein
MHKLFAVATGLFCGFAAFAIGWGLTSSRPFAIAFAVIAACVVSYFFLRSSFFPVSAEVPKGLKWVATIVTILALLQLGRLTVYMVDPTQVNFSSIPSSQFEVRHSCLSSYYCAIEAIDTHPNVYDSSLYELPGGDPNKPRQPRMLGSFRIDQFEYPPTFLLLPRVLHAVAPSFLEHRALWFGLNLLVIGAAMLLGAQALGNGAAARAMLLTPLVFAAMPTLSMLQKGNVQGMCLAFAFLAMLSFERRKNAVGGALLAYTIASKLYPGLLLLYFVAKRRWDAVLWTAAFGIVYVAISLADVGLQPYVAFLHHLPGLLGGEAFPALRNPGAVAVNLSIPGIIFKLKLFGATGLGFGAAKIVGWIYTVIAVSLTIVLSRRAQTMQDKILVFVAILAVATLRSPFLPQAYGTFPGLWLIVLLGALAQPNTRNLVTTMLVYAALFVYLPIDAVSPQALAVIMLAPQLALIALPIYVLLRLKPAPSLPSGSLQPTPA